MLKQLTGETKVDELSPPTRTQYLLPLPTQPALRRFLSPLKDDVIALKPTRQIVPRCCHESVFAAKVLKKSIVLGLEVVSLICVKDKQARKGREGYETYLLGLGTGCFFSDSETLL